MLCIWWDQLGVVYYALLKPSAKITRERYRTQLMCLSRALKKKWPQYQERHDKIILQHEHESKNGSIRGSPQKIHRFFEMVSNNCQKDGKK